MSENSTPPSRLQVWLLAARPKTLPAAAAPVIVGTAVAFFEGKFQPGPALAALLGALLLQIGANLANDVFDYKKGADTHQRTGPLRVTQAGLLTPAQVQTGMWVVFGAAALLGIYLIWSAGWVVLAMGVASILAALAYTGGPFPFGYYGLGDLFVFIFFGLVATCGSYFVQAESVSRLAVWAAIPMGLLITGILVVNNLRDIETDKAAGKRTLAVRLGAKNTQIEYLLCLVISYLIPLLLWLSGLTPARVLFSWLSLPLAVSLFKAVRVEKGAALNKVLAGTGRLALLYGLLFSIGLLLPVG